VRRFVRRDRAVLPGGTLRADHVAHTGPNDNHITDKVMIDGQETDVAAPDGTPIGPGLHGRYLLGADQKGRDVMVRPMCGGHLDLYRPGRRGGHYGTGCGRRSSSKPPSHRQGAAANHRNLPTWPIASRTPSLASRITRSMSSGSRHDWIVDPLPAAVLLLTAPTD